MFRTKWMYLCKQLLAHGLSMVFPVPFSVLFTRARYTYSQGHQNTATNPKRASERESVLTCCPRSVGRIMKILKSNQAMPAPSIRHPHEPALPGWCLMCVCVFCCTFLRQEANHALPPFVSLAGSSIRPDATVCDNASACAANIFASHQARNRIVIPPSTVMRHRA